MFGETPTVWSLTIAGIFLIWFLSGFGKKFWDLEKTFYRKLLLIFFNCLLGMFRNTQRVISEFFEVFCWKFSRTMVISPSRIFVRIHLTRVRKILLMFFEHIFATSFDEFHQVFLHGLCWFFILNFSYRVSNFPGIWLPGKREKIVISREFFKNVKIQQKWCILLNHSYLVYVANLYLYGYFAFN